MNSSLVRNRPRTAIFFVSMATLLFEVLITRVFSVTMWYHFAFMAISVAMFGMTAGALLVYFFPNYFAKERIPERVTFFSMLLSITILFAFLAHLSIPFAAPRSLSALFSLGLNFSVISIPFISSGILITLLLTRMNDSAKGDSDVSRIYAADLAGAGLGCVGVVFILMFADAATAILFSAFIATLGGLLFRPLSAMGHGQRRAAMSIAVVMLVATCLGSYLNTTGRSLFPLLFVKGAPDRGVIYEKWNSFSRVAVYDDPDYSSTPFGWGFSDAMPPGRTANQLMLNIDANAATPITRFNGNFDSLDYLKYDVTNVAHSMRPNSDVLVIGAGGGRDILSALLFKQKSVTAVEINNNIIGAVTGTYGDFSGHLDKIPNVHLVNDEARSYVARSKDKFNMIEISLIDTWAATAAGAYSLSENGLYTEDAWKIFLDHLKPNGVLSLSRWYGEVPGEVYRMATLATQTLLDRGVKDPRSHVIVVRNHTAKDRTYSQWNIGTMLLSNEPFTAEDIANLHAICAERHFDVVVEPGMTTDKHYDDYLSPDYMAHIGSSILNISPTTDENPFFFQMLNFRDILNPAVYNNKIYDFNMRSVVTLMGLFIIVLLLTVSCIVIPLFLRARNTDLKGSSMPFMFFSAIGLGFMIIEISQIERFSVFLGHPVYGFTVSLFSLLLSSGLGSLTTQSLKPEKLRSRSMVWAGGLLFVLLVIGIVTPSVLHSFSDATTPVRIALAALILAIPGFFMGMAFPVGMKTVSEKFGHITPWLWGINGAMSVLASVVAIMLSMEVGISLTYWIGGICYVLAAISLLRFQRSATTKLPSV